MNTYDSTPAADRWTSADTVYHTLYERIASLDLMPGDKISEAEVAAKFDISRQPVRDAFRRLGNMGLVEIRPQKATKVKKFSLKSIEKARFVRLSVELEVISRAVEIWDGSFSAKVEQNITEQQQAKADDDVAAFHTLDYEFHKIFCEAAQAEFAMDIISQNKAIVDRLCVLSLSQEAERMDQLIDDHRQLYAAIVSGDQGLALQSARRHLGRLDKTIQEIHQKHTQYFED